MVGQILEKRFWAVVAFRDKTEYVHVVLIQYDTEPELQDEIIVMQHEFRGMEVLSDYTKIFLN